MFLTAIRTLHTYGAWTNTKVLEAASHLSLAELDHPGAGGYGSVRETLVHIAASDWLFLERWQGRSPTSLWDPSEFKDVGEIRARWVDVEAGYERFIAGLTEADLSNVVSYVNLHGESWAYPLWQQILHQSNHATQHRGEVAALLTQFGRSPGWLDFLVFIDLLGGQPGDRDTSGTTTDLG